MRMKLVSVYSIGVTEENGWPSNNSTESSASLTCLAFTHRYTQYCRGDAREKDEIDTFCFCYMSGESENTSVFVFDKQLVTTLPHRRHVYKNAESGQSVGTVCIVPHPKRGVLYFVQKPTETLGPSFQRSVFPVRSWRCTAGCCGDGHTPDRIACGDGHTHARPNSVW